MAKQCTHLDQIKNVKPRAAAECEPRQRRDGCEDCLKTGDTWVSLRMCLVCGHVGCCNSSKNKHASKHFLATGHPVMESIDPEEVFRWCYVDELAI